MIGKTAGFPYFGSHLFSSLTRYINFGMDITCILSLYCYMFWAGGLYSRIKLLYTLLLGLFKKLESDSKT